MEKLTRRRLITQTSVGAGAAGVLVIAAACNTSNTTTVTPETTGISVPATDEPLAVFVTDPAKGTLIVMKGDQEVTVTNPGLAQSLLGLA